jgi:hypothetical protein
MIQDVHRSVWNYGRYEYDHRAMNNYRHHVRKYLEIIGIYFPGIIEMPGNGPYTFRGAEFKKQVIGDIDKSSLGIEQCRPTDKKRINRLPGQVADIVPADIHTE